MNLLIFSFLVGQLNRYFWPGSIWGRVNLLDLALFIIIAVALFRRQRPQLNPWLIGWLLVAIVSTIWGFTVVGWQGQPEAYFYLLRLVIYGVWFGLVGIVLKQRAYLMACVIGTGIAILGFIQLQLLPSISLRLTELTGFDPHSGRLFSTFFDPNYAAIVLVLTLLMTLALIWQGAGKARYYYLSAAAIQLVALLLTNSRSGLLALAVGLVIFVTAINWRYVLVVVLLATGVALFVPAISTRLTGALALDQTSRARFDSWQTATMVIDRQPILGVGYNNYQAATTILGRYQPRLGKIALAANASDSSLLTIWATTGLFGLVLALGWLLAEASQAQPTTNRVQSSTKAKFSRSQLAARRSVIAALLVNSWFLNSLLWPFGLFLLALALTPFKVDTVTTEQ
ncbi:MAG: O-antigen ligase family protein [bacterium]|nr:O-antigen ligase family protein [bacterium]